MQKQMQFKKELTPFQNNHFSKIIAVCLLIVATTPIYAQKTALDRFEPLMGKTWKAEGAWGDGSKFKQESSFEYGLDSTIVLVKSKGYTNQQQTEYGDRNHGIRKFDSESNSLKFWEYDVFGGITKGTVYTEGKNIRYEYEYEGTTVTDLWEYVDGNTYNFKVGSYADGEWKQVYLETTFNAEPENGFNFDFDHQSLVVTKLIDTGNFYRDILQLEEIPHPDRAPGFRWFKVKGNSQLHLIKKDVIEFKKDKSIHLCLSTASLEKFIEHLMAQKIDFYDWPGNKNSVTNRSDGVKQIYVQDPDGYWIEINNAEHN
ncbi:hypothetical protein [Allomuricauda sp. d1]|uniref:VOC family protein n=1 Tax=Allomuricauda sp. d1 TaxID=3136725 RepID=UPI0031D4FA11